jgi:hypothetical protein
MGQLLDDRLFAVGAPNRRSVDIGRNAPRLLLILK